jgi:hypothetical protein
MRLLRATFVKIIEFWINQPIGKRPVVVVINEEKCWLPVNIKLLEVWIGTINSFIVGNWKREFNAFEMRQNMESETKECL